MSYLVMECHDAYAVVLSSDGRFIKVANFQYEVGSTVNKVEPLNVNPVAEEKTSKEMPKWFIPVASLAASFMLIFLGAWQIFFATYGQLDIRINPEVSMDINRMDQIINLKGLNDDGVELIEGYTYQWKSTEQVSNELVDRAIEMGFLEEEGSVRIKASSANASWIVEVEDRIQKTIVNRDHGLTIHVTIEHNTDDDLEELERDQDVYVIPGPQLLPEESRPLPKPSPAPLPAPVTSPPVDDDWDDDDWDDDWDNGDDGYDDDYYDDDWDDDDYYDDDYYDDDYYDDYYDDDDWDDDDWDDDDEWDDD